MTRLQTILSALPQARLSGADATEMEIRGITADSRRVEQDFVFVAVKGTAVDGHDFIPKAIASGATVVVGEAALALPEQIVYVQVPNAAEALGILAHAYYGYPSRKLKLVGITGTNGKTTTATLCFHVIQDLGAKAGLISTVENKIGAEVIPSTHTTPDPVQLNQLLARMADAGCTHVFMEVSSHAAHQHRIAGLQFAGGVFTNITHDHLDYHKTFDQYIAAKKMFFDMLPKDAFALVNVDDRRGMVMLQNCHATPYTYSVKGHGTYMARIRENVITGLVLQLDGAEFHSLLLGEFNAWNILCVYAIGRLLGYPKDQVLTVLSAQQPVEGRFDVIYAEERKLTGIVDYAHTPDAVEKLLSTVRSMLKKDQKMLTVVGCGGDRDRAKRPVMAATAAKLSDRVLLTSDNPRSEEPDAIIREMESGLSAAARAISLSITDRKEAIRTAVMLAQTGDVICVVGKGHEKYQEIKGVKYPFDDKAVLRETFKSIAH